ncbi:hypothetical protein [Nocardia asiatica]|uniref:hypothetical protein n=1 Tax=Nocardia asiatica TaxID=209252 RepID=UPI00031786DF|nr:hypothetical protein [Nocardia asiatica]
MSHNIIREPSNDTEHEPSAATAAGEETLHPLVFAGGSDDLLEVSGYIDDEFDAAGPITVLVTAPGGARLWITAAFDTPPFRGHGSGWALGVVHADPAWTYPTRLTSDPDNPAAPAITLQVPTATTLTLHTTATPPWRHQH